MKSCTLVMVLSAAWFVAAPLASAQQGDGGAAASGPVDDDLAHGRRLLEGVRDNVFSFDDPAFYWFCRYVKGRSNPAALAVSEADRSVPWRFLLERPSDYRGRLVVIEGILAARTPFEVSGHGRDGLGSLYQCELSEVGTRSLCAVICVEDPEGIPIRSRVRAKGYFLKVRSYRTNDGEQGAGPLLVALRLEALQLPGRGLGELTDAGPAGTWVVAGTVVLAVFWLVLRRITRRRVSPVRGSPPPAGDGAASDGDFDWMQGGEE